MFNYPLSMDTVKTRGIRSLLKRPHNCITIKDDKGNTTGYSLETVYTPFKKDDVNVSVENNVLTVKCGKENKIKDEKMDYCGVSYQSYEFSVPLADNVDTTKITAKAEDGMLRIDMPLKEQIPENSRLQIEVK
jgi:HSP20 family protein